MSSVIDIYICPERDQIGFPPTAYMKAVMLAALSGAPVQMRRGHQRAPWTGGIGWGEWNWGSYDYRIDPAPRLSAPHHPFFKVGDWVVRTGLGVQYMAHGSIHQILSTTSRDNHQSLTLGTKGGDSWDHAFFRLATAEEVAAHLGNQVAPGHNPAGLKVSQVGEGYRLLTHSEIIQDSRATKRAGHVSVWFSHDRGYWGSGITYGDDLVFTYRTKLSPAQLAALIAPHPKVKVPLTLTDLPSVFWMRYTGNPTRHVLITDIDHEGVRSSVGSHHLASGFLYWSYLADLAGSVYEYSADRITWLPCHKLVESS